jgi:hypothetical protein
MKTMGIVGQSQESSFQRLSRPKSAEERRRWLERAIADRESGKPESEPGIRRVEELDRLRERLSDVVKEEAIPGWFDSPNQAFWGMKPLKVIERGDIDRLRTLIYRLESGVAS